MTESGIINRTGIKRSRVEIQNKKKEKEKHIEV